jgi:hypothetical protein
MSKSLAPTALEQAINDKAIKEIIRRSKEFPKDKFLALVKLGGTYHISGALLPLGMCGKIIPNKSRVVTSREALPEDCARLERSFLDYNNPNTHHICVACLSQMGLEVRK